MFKFKPCVLVLAAILSASCSEKAPEVPVPEPTANPVETAPTTTRVLQPGQMRAA